MHWTYDSGDKAIFKTIDTGLFAKSGKECTVVRRLTESEADLCETGPMYAIEFTDGSHADAFEDELKNISAITDFDIKRGLLLGLVRLSESIDGVVCRIGLNYFFFGGVTAEDSCSAWQYASDMDFDEIVRDIVDALKAIHDSDYDEWLYYRSYLNND